MTSVDALPELRVGEGWDMHALVRGRPLMIGGVLIPHTHGLQGHSDADVLLHAVIDALLGAAALGDIGTLFPDTDARHAGADSSRLLATAWAAVRAQGWRLVNADATVIAQAPRLAPHRSAMEACMAKVLGVAPERINVKAKTAEHLGPIGRGEGIAARAVVLLCR